MVDAMNALDVWTDAVRDALQLDPIDSTLVLDLARDVAHGVLRPAAPLTAYLIGVAVGRGAEPEAAAAAVQELIATWASGDNAQPDSDPRPND
jgi:Domain of unknown function (DUF6457)